jgi:hypothetical protein
LLMVSFARNARSARRLFGCIAMAGLW